jgi:hypothetical protein
LKYTEFDSHKPNGLNSTHNPKTIPNQLKHTKQKAQKFNYKQLVIRSHNIKFWKAPALLKSTKIAYL